MRCVPAESREAASRVALHQTRMRIQCEARVGAFSFLLKLVHSHFAFDENENSAEIFN